MPSRVEWTQTRRLWFVGFVPEEVRRPKRWSRAEERCADPNGGHAHRKDGPVPRLRRRCAEPNGGHAQRKDAQTRKVVTRIGRWASQPTDTGSPITARRFGITADYQDGGCTRGGRHWKQDVWTESCTEEATGRGFKISIHAARNRGCALHGVVERKHWGTSCS